MAYYNNTTKVWYDPRADRLYTYDGTYLTFTDHDNGTVGCLMRIGYDLSNFGLELIGEL